MIWWVLWTGLSEPAWNMALDEWLLSTAANRPPTLRLYGWSRPTVSLGRNERWRRAVRLDRLRAQRVDLVRRPTGGRAVYHHRELTYSVTAPLAARDMLGDHLAESLGRIAGALARGLKGVGLRPRVWKREKPLPRTDGTCFETPSRYELLSEGRKLVGHAQLRTPRALLQHGSIPVFDSVGPLRWLAGSQSEEATDESSATPLARLAGWSPDRLARHLAEAFAAQFEVPLRWVNHSVIDCEAVTGLVARRYGRADWNFRR